MIELHATAPDVTDLRVNPNEIAAVTRTSSGNTQVSMRNGQLFTVQESVADVVGMVSFFDRQARDAAGHADDIGLRR